MSDKAIMITKVKNIYIMLLHAISNENIAMVDHFLEDNLTAEFKRIIENNIKHNVKQVYRQPNISNITIIEENSNSITLSATIKYISYFINRETNKYAHGDNKTRITKTSTLKFRKNKLTPKTLYRCQRCGAGLQINSSSICPYCDTAIDDRFSPYVLCSII